MELHHSKHHQTYVTNLNKALQAVADAIKSNDIDTQISLQPAINFNGGGHINHSLFWQNLTPASSPEARPDAAKELVAEIQRTWTSLTKFHEAFSAKLLGIQGSGWGWLVKAEGSTQLRIITTKDQDTVPKSVVPIFGVDMWEHAYYLQVGQLSYFYGEHWLITLQYLNGKAAYVENIWKIINWATAEKRYLGGRDDAFAVLEDSIK